MEIVVGLKGRLAHVSARERRERVVPHQRFDIVPVVRTKIGERKRKRLARVGDACVETIGVIVYRPRQVRGLAEERRPSLVLDFRSILPSGLPDRLSADSCQTAQH